MQLLRSWLMYRVSGVSYVGSQPDGGLKVLLTLSKKAMKELGRDLFFVEYAQWCQILAHALSTSSGIFELPDMTTVAQTLDIYKNLG